MNVTKLVDKLKIAGYDSKEIDFLKEGFTNGFDISYEGPVNRTSSSANIPLKIGSEEELWNKLMKEVKAERVARPFDEVPFDNYIQSPIGLVPKKGSEGTRLIFHLSYSFDEKDGRSLNSLTPKDKCSVRYNDIDYAV